MPGPPRSPRPPASYVFRRDGSTGREAGLQTPSPLNLRGLRLQVIQSGGGVGDRDVADRPRAVGEPENRSVTVAGHPDQVPEVAGDEAVLAGIEEALRIAEFPERGEPSGHEEQLLGLPNRERPGELVIPQAALRTGNKQEDARREGERREYLPSFHVVPPLRPAKTSSGHLGRTLKAGTHSGRARGARKDGGERMKATGPSIPWPGV